MDDCEANQKCMRIEDGKPPAECGGFILLPLKSGAKTPVGFRNFNRDRVPAPCECVESVDDDDLDSSGSATASATLVMLTSFVLLAL